MNMYMRLSPSIFYNTAMITTEKRCPIKFVKEKYDILIDEEEALSLLMTHESSFEPTTHPRPS